MIANISLEDNMELMKRTPDKFYDLAIVDPPYGIGFGKFNRTNKNDNGERFKANKYKNSNWDSSVPDDLYFSELNRVSVNQIVFGGNYFIQLAKTESPNLKTIIDFLEYIKNSEQNWLFWHKQNPVPNFADGELAWLSSELQSDQFDYKYYGNIEGNSCAESKIHPTMKPVELYRWILSKYAKQNDKILDTHGGSMSLVLACIDLGFDIDCCELDPDYYESAKKRIQIHLMQQNMFREQPIINFIYK